MPLKMQINRLETKLGKTLKEVVAEVKKIGWIETEFVDIL
jgi:hypothetical protein